MKPAALGFSGTALRAAARIRPLTSPRSASSRRGIRGPGNRRCTRPGQPRETNGGCGPGCTSHRPGRPEHGPSVMRQAGISGACHRCSQERPAKHRAVRERCPERLIGDLSLGSTVGSNGPTQVRILPSPPVSHMTSGSPRTPRLMAWASIGAVSAISSSIEFCLLAPSPRTRWQPRPVRITSRPWRSLRAGPGPSSPPAPDSRPPAPGPRLTVDVCTDLRKI